MENSQLPKKPALPEGIVTEGVWHINPLPLAEDQHEDDRNHPLSS